MKFKRLLAALLSAMMITSCMSFVAGAEEAETEADIEAIEEVVAEEAEDEAQEEAPEEEEAAEEEAAVESEEEAEAEAETEEAEEESLNAALLADEETTSTTSTGVLVTFTGLTGTPGDSGKATQTKYYDAVNDVVFYRFENVQEYGLQWNTYSFGKPKVDTVDNTVNAAYRMRSNTSAAPKYNIYQGWMSETDYTAYTAAGKTDVNGKFGGGSFFGAATKGDETWETTTVALTPKKSDYNLEYFNQIQTYLAGGDDKPVGAYFDVAFAAIANDEASAVAEVEKAENYSAGYTISFDLNYTGAPALTEAPTANPAREGFTFKGWATDKYAASGEMDLTCLTAIPTADTTYYAIWDNAAITFNRRNGAAHSVKVDGKTTWINDTVTTINVGVGEVIPFPDDPTYMSHKFLGWSTEKDNKEAIVDKAAQTVTAEMVESGITYYAVWESTHDSSKPLFLVTAQKNDGKMAAEGGLGSVKYDAENDIVYKHFAPTDTLATVRCNMYSLTASNLHYTTSADKAYLVYYLRTNVTGNKPYIQFNSTTTKDGNVESRSWTFDEAITNETETPGWQKIIYEMDDFSRIGIVEHMDFSAVGRNATFTADSYFDISAIAVFDNKAAAEAYDIAAVSQVDRVTVTFDTYGGNETYEPVEVKSGTYSTDLVPFPETNPTKENYTFKGWAAAKHGTVLDTAAVTVPKADTTYYAVWEMAEPTVEAENAVYVDQTNGCDTCNDGRSATYPFATLDKAIAAVNVAGIDTIYIIGTYNTGKDYETFGNGTANSKLYIKGYSGKDSDTLRFVKFNSKNETVGSQFRLDADTEIDNITLYRASNDGGFMLKGKNLTIGENVASSGSMYLSQQYYTNATAENSILNVKSGKWAKLQHGIFSSGTFTGNFTINFGGTAEATQLDAGHGNSGSNQVFKGIFTLNMSDSAKIGTVQLQSTGGGSTPFNKLYGARIYNLNGGKITTIYTTPSSGDGQIVEGVTVIHVNKSKTVDNITKGAKDANTARVVVFNDTTPISVSDSVATVISVYGGKLTANVSVDSANNYAATINHYDIENVDETADMVNITAADGTVTTKAISELEGKLSADLFKAGVNRVAFYKSIDIEEPAHIKAYRDAGHKIVYVRRLATGKADGSDYINAVGYKNDMSAYTEAGKTTVFVFVDKINIDAFGVAQGSTAVITEYTDDGIFYFEGSVALTPTCSSASVVPANFIFDNIHILHKNAGAGGERIINASGNNLTFTETVTNDSSSFPGQGPLNIHAASDNGNLLQNSLGKMTVTLNGGSRLSVRVGGWGGSQVNGDVEFNVGGNAHVSSLNLGGHSEKTELTAAQRTITGNVTANIGGNATVGSISLTNQGIVTGNATINIAGGTVSTIDPTTGARGAVNGDVIINVTGGTLGNITAKSASVAGDIKAEIDLDNAQLTGTVDTSTFYAIAHKGEGEYAVNVDEETGAKTLALTFDNTKIKYVRITNGENVKSYTVAGDEVTLLADVDFSAIPLENGLTSVEFLNEGTEIANYTVKTYTMGTDGEYGEAAVETKTAEVGSTATYTPEAKTGFTISEGSTLSGTVAADGLLVLTVYYDRNQYKLYTKADAEAEAVVAGTYYYEEAVTAPDDPEKNGYTFEGWDIDVPATMPANDVTLTATWEKNAPTTADAIFKAGEGKFADGTTEKTVETTIGETPVAPEDPTRVGYKFDGWDPELTAITAEGATYTAQWEANKHNVIYTLDGEAYNKTEVAYGTEVTILADPAEKTGYSFSGWKIDGADAADFTMPDNDVTITGTFTANDYTVTYKVDGEVYGEVETYAYGANVTMREAPTKTGYTFSGWDKTLTTMPAENVEINGTFSKDEEPFPTSATYKTYGYYDAINDTYKVELKFSGAKVNQGSFGFNFPTDQMTFKSVTANADAGIELLGNISPIYANGEGYYADTWAGGTVENAGHIDATTEEVLVATFEFSMTEEQRTAFEAGVLATGKFTEYVVASHDAKYHNGTNYLATPYATDFTLDKVAINYASHTDTETAPEIVYTTYGTYDEYNGTYSIDVKVKGAKINLGAFGLAFNEEYMTFDPNAENAVVLADNIANYLGITLHNAADGYAFAFDGSSQADGYVDASTEEVILATLNLKMTPAQREAFVEAGKTMSIYVPTTSDTVDAATLAKYYDGGNYLVSIYVPGLATPKLPATYAAHKDEVIEATVADVEVEVTFASKAGETVANIAQIRLDDGTAVAIEEAGNTEETLAYEFKGLNIGQKYTVTVEKNGYLAGVAEIEVVKGTNEIKMTLLAGDIKGAETDTCGDGTVDLSDFVRLIRAFDTEASNEFKATVDLDESGLVNVTDLNIIKTNYNKTTADNTVTVNGEAYTPAA